MLYALIAVVTAIVAVFSFYKYTNGPENTVFFVVAIISSIATVILGAIFLSGRIGKKEDIHITE